MHMHITMAAAVAAYRAGNDRGEGYAPYTDEDESLVSALLGRLQAADHPAWGDDWSEWLDATAEPIARELVLP
jgi:hypothetical protein